MTVEIVFNRLPEIAAHLEAEAPAIVARTAYEIQAAAQDAAPVDTGALRASITAEQEAALTWIVAVGVAYGIYQEFGTYKMAAHPFLLPAFNRLAPKMLSELAGLLAV